MECREAKAVWVNLSDLRPGRSPRQRGLNPAHVSALVEREGQWPPVLVERASLRIIDGHHRVAAARELKLERLPVILFDGSAEDAFIEAVRQNVTHGLPLTLYERRGSAERLLRAHPEWSDRRIAEICALSPRTVARVRTDAGIGSDADEIRIGMDGRQRRTSPEANRLRIAEALDANPHASLRSIAQVVGTSPETVRRVRQRMAEGRGSGPSAPAIEILPANVIALTHGTIPSMNSSASTSDPALMSTDDGQEFAAWFDGTDPGHGWVERAASVPLSRVYELADQARCRAEVWNRFAQILEERARQPRAV